MNECKNCGTKSNGKFCPNCGDEMIPIEEEPKANNICPNCGIEVNSKFCQECGASVNPDAAPFAGEVYTEQDGLGKADEGNIGPGNITFSPIPVVETKKKTSKKKKIIIGVIVVLVLLFGLVMCSSETPTSTTGDGTETNYSDTDYDDEYSDEEYEDDSEEEVLTDEEVLQNAKNYKTGKCKEIAYDKLARNPDQYQAEQIKLSGRVLQVMEGDTDYYELRVAVNDDYDTVMYVTYDHRILESRILEDDYITLYGASMGTITYESTMGGNITIPAMVAGKIVFN